MSVVNRVAFALARTLCVGSMAAVIAPVQAQVTTVTVAATADLFNAGLGALFDGTAPVAIAAEGLSEMTFSVSAGNTVSYNIGTGSNFNDADGIGSVSSMFSTGGAGISGITAPHAGFLAGVFLSAAPSTTAPVALNFTATGTAFTDLFPLLQQAFFIGDGLTGQASGAVQRFHVPAGATTLYLGFIDACGYSGGPSCYQDNSGSFTVTTQAVPEPSVVAMLLAGLVALGLLRRRA